MDLEFHVLDLRYEALRSRNPARERRLLSSLAEIGQQTPIIVVCGAPPAGHVVIDGYKRVRLLRKLGHDTVCATAWAMDEADALLLERMMRAVESDHVLEQAWFLRELRDRFALSGAQLARRFDRTESWVSRRLALAAQLPESVQRHVYAGGIGAHAAMKYLVPLARANARDSEALADAVAPLRLSTRAMGIVMNAWSGASAQARAVLLKDPTLALRAHQEALRASQKPDTLAQQVINDLGSIAGIAGRTSKRARRGELQHVLAPELEEIGQAVGHARREVTRLFTTMEREMQNVRRGHARSDSAPT